MLNILIFFLNENLRKIPLRILNLTTLFLKFQLLEEIKDLPWTLDDTSGRSKSTFTENTNSSFHSLVTSSEVHVSCCSVISPETSDYSNLILMQKYLSLRIIE